MALPISREISTIAIAEMCRRSWAPPTLGVTFDLSHVLVLVWEEPQEQAVSVNEVDYLGGLGRTVRLMDRLQGGERWVIVWRCVGVAQQAREVRAGVVVGAKCWRMHCVTFGVAECFIFGGISCELPVSF